LNADLNLTGSAGRPDADYTENRALTVNELIADLNLTVPHD
jgi:hypothetical protein